MVSQVLTHEGAGRPSTATSENIERVCDVVLLRRMTIDEVANCLQISHGSAYEIIHNRLGFVKFVQDVSQYNSQCCRNKRAWTSANNIWIAMAKKVMPSWSESSLVTKRGSTITSQSVNGRLWSGNIHNRPALKSSKANHQQENGCLQFLGAHKAQYWNIIRRGTQQ